MPNNKIFKRTRIEKALNNIFDFPLTVVSATMGYGKTTSVREFLKTQENVIWVSLNSSQGMETLCWSKLCKGIGKIFPETGDRLAELGFPFNLHQINQVLDYIIDYKSDQKTILVIDDYHLIEHNKQIGTLVELLIQEEIPNLHMVLISRTRPNFNHINLLAKGLCYYIDSSVLAFTVDEIQEYFHFMGFPALSQRELERIASYTMGWISAIYLIMLGSERGLRTEIGMNISQLIEENFFNRLNPQTREVLLHLSVFDSFTLKQAAESLENKQVYEIVNELVDKNSFIETDPLTGAFQIHHVLLDYLRARLDYGADDVKALCRRAGKWFLEQEEYVTAFDYYHRAGNVEELLDYLNSVEQVEISLLDNDLMSRICPDLSPHLSIKYPILFLQIALNLILSGDGIMIDRGVDIFTLIRDFYGQTDGFAPSLCRKISAEVEIINTVLCFNDVKRMAEHIRKANELFHGGISSIIFRHNEFTFGLPCFLYSYYREPGKLQETLNDIRELPRPVCLDGCGTGCEYLAMAEFFLITGDLEQAEQYARQAIDRARTMMQISIELCADFVLMRLNLAKGKVSEAKQMLREAREMLAELKSRITRQNNLIYNTTIDLCEGYVCGCLKQPELIPDWLRAGDFSNAPLMFQGMGFPLIIYGKTMLLSGNWPELDALCKSVKKEYNVQHNQLGLLHNAIYEAAANYHLHGKEAGIQLLLPALREAQMDGILLPFAENAEFLTPMLKEIGEKDGMDPQYFSKLESLCSRYIENLKVHAKSAAVLTERETEVLKLIEEGLTQKEIANTLIVSCSTVKRHLENIYQKLEVNNKISAIRCAKILKIL